MKCRGQSSNRYVSALVAVVAAFWAATSHAQLAPWQQPPGHAACGDEGSPCPGGSQWNGEGEEQPGGVWFCDPGRICGVLCDSAHDRIWFRSEFLGWWTKGFSAPALLTGSPPGTAIGQAGVLGSPDTRVLLGDSELQGGFHPGERIVFGSWLGFEQIWGLEASYLQIARQTDAFQAGGANAGILARPFFNSQSGVQDAEIINFPGQQTGTFASAAASELQVAGMLVRRNLTRQGSVNVDFTAGVRYQQLNDHLEVGDTLSFSGSAAAFPAGTVVTQTDRFDTRNVFLGGEMGLTAALDCQRWMLEGTVKIAVGQTNSQVTIDGVTRTAIPNQTVTFQPGGLLALPSNMGVFDSERLSMVPELGLTWGWKFTPQLRGTIGYDILYWTGVARPGDQIDLNVDPRQLPPAATTTATRPAFALHTSDYWAQGVNLGLDLQF